MAICICKLETNLAKPKNYYIFNLKAYLESPVFVDLHTNNATSLNPRYYLLRRPEPPWVPKLGSYRRNCIFFKWKCLDNSYLWDVFHRSLKKNKPKFENMPDPYFRVGRHHL
jgi:hypothetical protein